MPAEFFKIKESLKKAHPKWDADKISKVAAMTFSDTFGISLQKAHKLSQQGKWESWKKRKGFGEKKSHVLVGEDLFSISEEVKSFDNEHGRFIQFDLAVADLDDVGDELEPECIKSIADQLQGQIGIIRDPEKIPEHYEVAGAAKGGINHEHVFLSKDIVPVTTIVEAKSIDNNNKVRCTAKVNEDSIRSNNFWNMINNRVLTHASIEYKAKDWYYKHVHGKLVRVLNDIALTGYAWTAKPAQKLAGVATTFVKSIDLEKTTPKNEEEVKMPDEEEKEVKEEATEAKEEAPVEAPKEEAPKEAESESEEVKSLREENAKLKEEVKSKEQDEKIAELVAEQVKSQMDTLKSEKESLVNDDEPEQKDEVKAKLDEFHEIKSLDDKWANAGRLADELFDKGSFVYEAKIDKE